MKTARLFNSTLLILIALVTSSFSLPGFYLDGLWLTEGGRAKIKIYKNKSGEYQGKLIWTKDNSPLAKKTLGATIIDEMKSVNENKYEGFIYDPTKNSKYDSYITVVNQNTINLRGYLGISLLGRTEKWTREQ